ncbi:MAG: HD domain-containing protein [Candidatus Nealsonbacteria bacterium]|nr:HD domain-containing protein [Candidatus Nealsonbacteria bacterium]
MEELLNFLIEVGKLKRMPRRGWVINQIKNGETIAEHIFRAAILGWVLAQGKNHFNVEKLIKIALVHDLCEVYAGDITPYDSILPKSKKMLRELMKTWPRFTASEKKKRTSDKYRREVKGLKKLVAKLPPLLKKEIENLWLDYEKGLTPEGRFFRQADRMENFLQAYEYWKKFKNPPLAPWWLWAREFFDEPILVEFMDALEEKFHKKKRSR